MVVVEPIETPTSEVEHDESLAHSLIQALLNCWHAYFKPNKGKFKVKISIPWHRDITDDLDFPQKVFQHKAFVEWNKDQLKAFIEKRIEFEFNRVQRFRYVVRDTDNLWYELFDSKVINGYCGYEEDSFDYFVRHTHFRPRDLLRLVRHCVVLHAKSEKISIDDAIKQKIPANTIKQAFHAINPEVTKQLIIEGERRFPGIKQICNNFTGLPLPFTIEQLRKRIKEISDIAFSEAARYLWETGIIGVVALPNTIACSQKMEVHFSLNARKSYTDSIAKRQEHVWTWFEYNYNGNALDLYERLERYDCSKNYVVFHPKTYELFLPRHDKDFAYPIG
jgi:ribosomal protein L31E